nr:oligoendopeptidase F [Salinibacillus xinjiangensis]
MAKNTKAIPKREEVPTERTWRLEDIFETDDAWEKEFQQVKQLYPKITEYQGKVAESPERLLELMKLQDDISQRLAKLFTYAHMRYDQDTTNSFYQELNTRAETLLTQASSAMSFIVPEILQLDQEKVEEFLAKNEELHVYKHYLEDVLRQRPHILDEKSEALLAEVSEVTSSPEQTFGMLNNADIDFPAVKDEEGNEIDLTHGRFIRFLESKERRVREDAFNAMYNTFGKYKNTFASTLSGAIKRDNFYAKVRNYDSARQSALDSNKIPESVHENLIEAVNDKLSLLHRYVSLRKKVLGVDNLHMYDLYVPLVDDVDMEIKYDEAKDLVLKGLKPLGKDYQNKLKEGFENRWIDVEENKGKRSGAYSSGVYGTNPYILLNWQDNINNLFTLAHELGHSLHSYYTRENQPYRYGNYSIFVAEVASTCNEALLNDYLLKETNDKKEKLYLLNHFLEGFRGTVFRQTMFAEFEHDIHVRAQEGNALTADKMTEMYYELNKKYFGDDITIDDKIGLEWARIPHFYYNYYVYQYATGYSAATTLASQILSEGDAAVTRYLDYLKAGSSDYPIEVLKRAGVDMTSKDPILSALDVFEEKLNEFEELLK